MWRVQNCGVIGLLGAEISDPAVGVPGEGVNRIEESLQDDGVGLSLGS